MLLDSQESRGRPGLNPGHNLRLNLRPKLKPLQRLRLHLITVPTMVIIIPIMVMVILTNIIHQSTTIIQDIIMATITMVFLIIFQQLSIAIFIKFLNFVFFVFFLLLSSKQGIFADILNKS